MRKERRAPNQISADKIIKKQLNILGEKIYNDAKKDVRVDTNALNNSINFRVKPDTTLTLTQLAYGKYVTPKNKSSDNMRARTNVLKIKAEENLPTGARIIIKEITESILYPFKK